MLSDSENMKICVTGVHTDADPVDEYIENIDAVFLQELYDLNMISAETYNEYMKPYIK